MHARYRLVLATLVSSALLAVAVGSATAGRLSISNMGFRLTWEAVRFTNAAGSPTIECPLTLEGSFHSATIKKVARALIGLVTRQSLKKESCTGGHATINQETLPWHVSYSAFAGRLPAIEDLIFSFNRYSFDTELTVLGFRIECFYREQGQPEETLQEIIEVRSGQLTVHGSNNGRYISKFTGSELCDRRVFVEGFGPVFQLGRASRLTVTLI
jgi:hypothetical protein